MKIGHKAFRAGDLLHHGEGIVKYFRLFISFINISRLMNTCLKPVLVILLAIIFTSSCRTKKKEEVKVDYRAEMIEADRSFSKMSEEKGMKNALMHYIDNKGVLLRPNSAPLVSGNAVDYISQGEDTSYTMTWEPSDGNVATSGEMGYTYGIYSLKRKNKDSVFYGTYMSVWKKQEDGKWKFVLGTGNEGIE